MGIGRGLLIVHEARTRHARLVQNGLDFFRGVLRKEVRERLFGHIGRMASVGNNALPFREQLTAVLQAKQWQASFQNAWPQEQHVHFFTVVAYIGSVQSTNKAMRAFFHVFFAVRPTLNGILRLNAHHGFELRHVDGFATAGFLALQQSSERHAKRVECRGIIARERHGGNRRLALNAIHAHRAAKCLGNWIVARTLHVAFDARLPKAGNMRDNQARIHFPQFLVAEPFACEAPADRCLYEHVSGFDKLQESIAPLALQVIHGEASHITAVLLRRCAMLRKASHIGIDGVFDPYDVGAVLGIELSREGRSDRQAHHHNAVTAQKPESGYIVCFRHALPSCAFLYSNERRSKTRAMATHSNWHTSCF